MHHRIDGCHYLDSIHRDLDRRISANDVFSTSVAPIWSRISNLSTIIDKGDHALGIPPYNGGLFSNRDHPVLDRVALPDKTLAHVVEALSREGEDGERHYINYRDLSVQQLGAVYERLLERDVALDQAGQVSLRPNAFARKNTGSYYTPDELVRLVIRRAVEPLLAERRAVFAQRTAALAKDRRPKAERIADLRRHDPADAFLKLRICDPAMGSGHFLVALVDYLADETLDAMTDATASVGWADGPPYTSPLAATILRLREHICEQAERNG